MVLITETTASYGSYDTQNKVEQQLSYFCLRMQSYGSKLCVISI